MDFETTEALRERHPAWRLLRAGNAPLILSFLGHFFVEGNRGATAVGEVADALDDDLYVLNAATDPDQPRFPKSPRAYLEDWATPESGYLRRFYPAGDDEVHYEVTPAFERAYAWAEGLKTRSFVGTESRLHTAVELLRQIVHGSETDPASPIGRAPAPAGRAGGRDRRCRAGPRERARPGWRPGPLPAVRRHGARVVGRLSRSGGELPHAGPGCAREDRRLARFEGRVTHRTGRQPQRYLNLRPGPQLPGVLRLSAFRGASG